jgi:hypothetical protein
MYGKNKRELFQLVLQAFIVASHTACLLNESFFFSLLYYGT